MKTQIFPRREMVSLPVCSVVVPSALPSLPESEDLVMDRPCARPKIRMLVGLEASQKEESWVLGSPGLIPLKRDELQKCVSIPGW